MESISIETIILKSHIVITTIFLLFFVFKTVLLLAGKTEMLDKIRKVKIIDMILGLLIIGTGAYIWWALSDIYGHRMWLDIKVTLVLVAIPMGIISMKKESKALAILVCLILIYVYGVAETKSLTFSKTKTKPKTEINEIETE